MWIIQGNRESGAFCDGLARRSFLQVGALSFAGLTLADILRAEAQAGGRQADKSVIHVYLAGGPPHQDMWDIKTEAPAEIRGEFRAIPTSVPGIEIGELFPMLAQRMEHCAIIRTVVGSVGKHEAHQCLTGWAPESLASLGGRPSMGATLAKLLGPTDPAIPPFVGLAKPTKHAPWSDPGTPGFLGPAQAAFKPDGPGMENLTLNGITPSQLAERRQLLSRLDRLRRDLDQSGMMAGMDTFKQRALDVLTSNKLVDALDLSKEEPWVLERYGTGQPYPFQYDGAPTDNTQLLLARRLVEVGVRCVTLSYGRWDSHSKNFDLMRDHGPKLDRALSALLDDLRERGLLQDVLVVVWGEFGRTPRINKEAGRDHWPQVNSALLCGGGLRTGQVIGKTNRLGEIPVERPVSMQEIVATIYHKLGVDPRHTVLHDPTGRPQYLVDHRDPIPELV